MYLAFENLKISSKKGQQCSEIKKESMNDVFRE